ncbi:26173_t:CDS:1, partial [Gigaspora margarita]
TLIRMHMNRGYLRPSVARTRIVGALALHLEKTQIMGTQAFISKPRITGV